MDAPSLEATSLGLTFISTYIIGYLYLMKKLFPPHQGDGLCGKKCLNGEPCRNKSITCRWHK